MNRTDEVKQRLGPILERVKKSLARIQALEQSLAGGQVDENSEGVSGGRRTIFVAGLGDVESRHYLKRSMGALKKKIHTLQQMEESFSTSEDRREHLQHYILQVSLSKPMMELALAKRRNRELELRLSVVERELHKLQDKKVESNMVNDCDVIHSQKFDDCEWDREGKEVERGSLCPMPGTSSVSMENHDFVRQAEEANVLSSTKQEEDEEGKMDQEVGLDMFRRNEELGCYTKSSDSVRSCGTAVTDPETDSSTVESVSDMETSSDSQDVNVSLSGSHDQSKEYDDYLDDPLDSSHAHHECDESRPSLSSSYRGQEEALMVKLMARIKKLEQDNRELQELVSMQGKDASKY